MGRRIVASKRDMAAATELDTRFKVSRMRKAAIYCEEIMPPGDDQDYWAVKRTQQLFELMQAKAEQDLKYWERQVRQEELAETFKEETND